MHSPFYRSGGNRAFSVLEVLVVVAVLSIAFISVAKFAGTREAAGAHKLRQTTKALNQSIEVYLASGGKIDPDWGAVEVIGALKARARSERQHRIVGLTENMVDQRLGFEESSGERELKAVWDASAKRFQLVETAAAGITDFQLSDANIPAEGMEDERATGLLFADTGHWVWDYQDRSNGGPARGPTPVTSQPPAGGGAPPTGGGPTELAAPTFSHAAGEYVFSDFDLPVVISAGDNTPGTFQIFYRLGAGPFRLYNGNPLSVPQGSDLVAYAKSVNASSYADSPLSVASYNVEPFQLSPPTITANHPHFDSGSRPTIRITLTDPNDSRVPSTMRYRVEGGPWTAYSGAFDLDVATFASGAQIEAAVFGDQPWVQDSIASGLLLPVKLQPPVFAVESLDFVEAEVTLTNPNPVGSSLMRHQTMALPSSPYGAETLYAGAMVYRGEDYPDGGVRVSARSTASSERFLDSDPATVDVPLVDPDDWSLDGGASGTFANGVGLPSMDESYSVDGSMFSWGTPTFPNWNRSVAEFTGNDFTGAVPGAIFKIGEIHYFNGDILGGTGANGVDLSVNLQLGFGQNVPFTVPLELINVPNNTGSQAGDADFVKINYNAPPPQVELFGKPYRVILGFGQTSANGYSSVSQFHVFENESASADVHAVVAPPAVANAIWHYLRFGGSVLPGG